MAIKVTKFVITRTKPQCSRHFGRIHNFHVERDNDQTSTLLMLWCCSWCCDQRCIHHDHHVIYSHRKIK